MESDKKRIADDMYKKCGALVSHADIQRFCGCGKNKSIQLTAGLRAFGRGTGKRYFYEDVAEAIVSQ